MTAISKEELNAMPVEFKLNGRDVSAHPGETIIQAATQKLGRGLTERELAFIKSRGGFLALEMILDTVKAETPAEVERYLNSE